MVGTVLEIPLGRTVKGGETSALELGLPDPDKYVELGDTPVVSIIEAVVKGDGGMMGVISGPEALRAVLGPEEPRGVNDAVELDSGYGTDGEDNVGSGGVMILSYVADVVPATVDELLTGRPGAVVDGDVDDCRVGVMERL